MNKTEKSVAVSALHEKMAKATFAAAVSFNKLDANTAIELRKAMRANKIDYKVIKNTLAKLAAKGTEVEKITEHFEGPVAIALGYGDMVESAKIITDVFKKSPTMVKIKGAVADGTALDAKGVEALSKMPGLPETRSMLLALINTPATMLVRLLNEPGSQMARVIQAHVDKSGATEEKAA
jgi:large subunit ribosomal protein L10